MKTVLWIFMCGLIVTGSATYSQTPHTSGADTSANRNMPAITDTSFLNQGIKQQILDIRLAQMAADRASSPRVKKAANDDSMMTASDRPKGTKGCDRVMGMKEREGSGRYRELA